MAIVLYPFTLQVAQDVASALLYHFVRYHAHLGFRVLQYTQARLWPHPPAPRRLHAGLQRGSSGASCDTTPEPGCELSNAFLVQCSCAQHAPLHFYGDALIKLLVLQPAHLPGFLADEQLRGFVRGGQLELVLWDHLGECDGPPHMRCWQPIVYRCALAGLAASCACDALP